MSIWCAAQAASSTRAGHDWPGQPPARPQEREGGQVHPRAGGTAVRVLWERCTDEPAALRREAALRKLTKAQKEALCAEWAEKNLPRLSLATRADAAEILHMYNSVCPAPQVPPTFQVAETLSPAGV